jgi:hypothetical protein
VHLVVLFGKIGSFNDALRAQVPDEGTRRPLRRQLPNSQPHRSSQRSGHSPSMGRLRKAATLSSISPHNRLTWLLEMPVMPIARTSSSTERVDNALHIGFLDHRRERLLGEHQDFWGPGTGRGRGGNPPLPIPSARRRSVSAPPAPAGPSARSARQPPRRRAAPQSAQQRRRSRQGRRQHGRHRPNPLPRCRLALLESSLADDLPRRFAMRV